MTADRIKNLLVVDDEASHRMMIEAVLQDVGWVVDEAESGEEALRILEDRRPSVVLLDMRMPGMDGQETLQKILEIHPGLPVIMLTAHGTVDTAVEAMKHGAYDYLSKPADNDELIAVLDKAWEYSRLILENDKLRRKLQNADPSVEIAGSSLAIRKVVDFIRQAGPSEATVLVLGESGTGKELIAQALHDASTRASNALVKVNCAALPGELLESELFGYVKGAFTGAVRDKPGRFQLARGGTIFLDEVGELPFPLQAKLLRVLQERVVEPLGGVHSTPVDVRIIAATNRNLKTAVARGEFREDLYFRLNVLEIIAPPLRERLDDLPILVSRLLDKLSRKNRMQIQGVSPSFLDALSNYSWPGNVRELENVLERALILTRSNIITPDTLPSEILNPPAYMTPAFTNSYHPAAGGDLPAGGISTHLAAPGTYGTAYPGAYPPSTPTQPSPHPDPYPEYPPSLAGSVGHISLDDAERDALQKALDTYGGHREKTADALGISRRTLQYKLKKFGLIRR